MTKPWLLLVPFFGDLAGCAPAAPRLRMPSPSTCPSLAGRPADPADTTIYAPDDVTTRVTRLSSPPEPYPRSAFRDRVNGQATAEFVVDAAGRPELSSFRMLTATAAAFGEATTHLLGRSFFCPAARDGRPVRARVTRGVRFALVFEPRGQLLYARVEVVD
jgi:outer membrane biosynthesis protein TonB